MSRSSFSNFKPTEMTFTIEDADLDKLYDVLKDINVKECPWFEVQDKHGNKAKYYRESRWIPCTPETMPKKDGEYLVTFEEGYADDYNLSLVSIAPFEVDCEGFGFWKEHFDFASMGSLGSDWEEIPAVAWQPLPSPYREED